MKLNDNFNQQEFIDWIDEFLPDFSKDIRKVDVPSGLSGVESIQTLGESSLGVRVYLIETNTDPSRRKVGLATESFALLKNYGTPNALIAYYGKDISHWRLSLLTSTPVWSEGKIITKLSNPRRQSYILGPKSKVKTPHQFLLGKGKVVDFNDLRSRFSLEVVNKEFYKEISHAFTRLVGGTLAQGRSKKSFESLLRLPSVKDHSQISLEFAVRLIGRIIFCWFLREKRSIAGHSLMPKELLSSAAVSDGDYYHRILEPIFFEILNKPVKSRKESFVNDLFSAIPYLNGGLFSPHEDDFFNYNENKQAINHNLVVIPDEWLKSLFEVLETYNFTIDENTSFDEELSIDPEMLGRIFENLLAEINPETGESARKSTGSYYTPRVIVDYMIDESLYLYLKDKTHIAEGKLHSLISYDLEDDNTNPLDDRDKEKITEELGSIKILDPACGSGAFPIGALQKIVFILQQVDPEGRLWFRKQLKSTSPEIRRVIEREFSHKNFDYIRKLGVIRENIYGIDIQPIATEISRLRCFLTLVVDERIDDSLENRGVEPLPNLDFKFVTANSLIGLPTTGKATQAGLFEDNEGISELKEVREMFFNASGSERDALKLQFVQAQNKMFQRLISEGRRGHADLTTTLTSWDPFTNKAATWFDPEWMFGIDDGFDIVIANPPYISYGLRGTQKMTPEERKVLVTLFPHSAEYKISIYAIFMDKAIQLSKVDGGIQTYIVPDSFLLGRYFSKVRAQILNNCEIIHLSWMPYKIFEATVGYSIVYTFQKKVAINPNHEVTTRFIKSNNEIADKTYKEYKYHQSYFKTQKHSRFRMFFDKVTMDLIGKVEKDSVPLGEYYTGRTGVRSLIGQKNIVSKERSGDTWQKGLTSGSQVLKYRIAYDGDYINIDPKLLNKGGWDYEVIHNPKLLIRQTGDSLIAGLDTEGYYHLNNVHSFAPKNPDTGMRLKYVLALINSKLLTWFYQTTSLETGRTMAQTDIETLECLPIKKIGLKEQERFVEAVDKVLSITDDNDYLQDSAKQSQVKQYEKQISKMVYELYGISQDEIKIIES